MSDNSNFDPEDRRPIASRETKWAEAIASLLVSLRFTPNGISLIGMAAGILAGVSFYLTQSKCNHAWICWLTGAGLVQLRLLCNMLDGMVAVSTNQASATGELYNEIPDRVSDAFTLVGFGYASGAHPALGFSAAVLAVFVAYVRAMGKATSGIQEFCGPMAKPQRMFIVTVAAIYCALVPAFWPASAYQQFSAAGWALILIIIGCVVTALRRLRRISSHLNQSH